MSKNQVNITYYQFNIKLKLFNNSITKEKYAFWLYFYDALDKIILMVFNKIKNFYHKNGILRDYV